MNTKKSNLDGPRQVTIRPPAPQSYDKRLPYENNRHRGIEKSACK